MRKVFMILAVMITVTTTACKTKKTAGGDGNNNSALTELSTGKVSHQYRETGCPTVIIVEQKTEESPLTLIPLQKLPDKFDKDGLRIKFHYRLLRMPNPAGCSVGLPAEITDISK